MGFFISKIFYNFVTMEEKRDYDKLRLDVLEHLINVRNIECKMKKDVMIKMLKLDDAGKYVEPMKGTTYEKNKDGFIIGVDIRNHGHLTQLGKLVEKKEAKCLNRSSMGMLYYWSKGKLL